MGDEMGAKVEVKEGSGGVGERTKVHDYLFPVSVRGARRTCVFMC